MGTGGRANQGVQPPRLRQAVDHHPAALVDINIFIAELHPGKRLHRWVVGIVETVPFLVKPSKASTRRRRIVLVELFPAGLRSSSSKTEINPIWSGSRPGGSDDGSNHGVVPLPLFFLFLLSFFDLIAYESDLAG
jgi:hypothetical protein